MPDVKQIENFRRIMTDHESRKGKLAKPLTTSQETSDRKTHVTNGSRQQSAGGTEAWVTGLKAPNLLLSHEMKEDTCS